MPEQSKSKEAGLLIYGLTEARGSLAGFISSPRAFYGGNWDLGYEPARAVGAIDSLTVALFVCWTVLSEPSAVADG